MCSTNTYVCRSSRFTTLYLLIQGLLLLGLGMFTFFNGRLNVFIDQGNLVNQKVD